MGSDTDDGLYDLAFELFLQMLWRTGQQDDDIDFDEDRWFAAARDHANRPSHRLTAQAQ